MAVYEVYGDDDNGDYDDDDDDDDNDNGDYDDGVDDDDDDDDNDTDGHDDEETQRRRDKVLTKNLPITSFHSHGKNARVKTIPCGGITWKPAAM